MRLMLAIRCFVKVILDATFSERVRELTETDQSEESTSRPSEAAASPPPTSRNEAIALLATLQREARFVDLVNETLDGYSDAQVGAAAREVLADCGKVLSRVFALKPVADVAEGESTQVPEDYDTGRLRLTGNVSRQPPVTGRLIHSGWVATQCELASWTGSPEAAMIVAPAEVEVV